MQNSVVKIAALTTETVSINVPNNRKEIAREVEIEQRRETEQSRKMEQQREIEQSGAIEQRRNIDTYLASIATFVRLLSIRRYGTVLMLRNITPISSA